MATETEFRLAYYFVVACWTWSANVLKPYQSFPSLDLAVEDPLSLSLDVFDP
jgi:hypothetical protein